MDFRVDAVSGADPHPAGEPERATYNFISRNTTQRKDHPVAALKTDTAAQAALGQHIGEVATASTASINAAQGEVQALAGQFVGSSGSAVQAKMVRLQEAGAALMNEIHIIGEKVGVAAGGYTNTDETGAGIIGGSAGQAF